jgi:hypothetical protein
VEKENSSKSEEVISLPESKEAKIDELLQQWDEARPFSNNPDKAKEIFDKAREGGIESELYKKLFKLYMRELNETI